MTPSRWDLSSTWPQRIVGVVLLVFLLPLAVVAGIWSAIKGGADTCPNDLAKMLRDVAQEGDNSPYWDELECVNLRNPQLEEIRRDALTVPLPLAPEGRARLIELAKQAEAFTAV